VSSPANHTGAGLWFGNSSGTDADWIFLIAGPPSVGARYTVDRNLDSSSGGTNDFFGTFASQGASQSYTMTVDRTIAGSTITNTVDIRPTGAASASGTIVKTQDAANDAFGFTLWTANTNQFNSTATSRLFLSHPPLL